MRPRTVLILLAIVAVLWAFTFFFEGDLPSTDERAARSRRVLDLQATEVTSITIDGPGGRVVLERSVSAEKTPTDWRLIEPMVARADQDLTNGFVDSLASLEKTRTLEEVAAPEVGLEAPRATVTTLDSAGESTVLTVGSAVPAGASMIVTAADSGEIVVVGDEIWFDLERAAGDWRSREAFGSGRERLERIELQTGGRSVVLAKREDGFWLEEPLTDRAAEEVVTELVSELTGMRIERFVDEPEASQEVYQSPQPPDVVTAGPLDAAAPTRLVWGGAVSEDGERFFGQLDEQIIETATDLGKWFERSLSDWRSLELTSFETFQIDSLRVTEVGSAELQLDRAGANWQRGEEEISFTTVSDLLYALVDAKADGVVDSEAIGGAEIEAAAGALEVTLASSDQDETIYFFEGPQQQVMSRSSKRDAILLLNRNVFRKLQESLLAVRQAPSSSSLPEIEVSSE